MPTEAVIVVPVLSCAAVADSVRAVDSLLTGRAAASGISPALVERESYTVPASLLVFIVFSCKDSLTFVSDI